tara:strand:+ start:619 stop:1275 length:657 start_codon:yes stop_codon:yes gene_type:complete
MNSEISQRIISSVILIPVALFFIIKGSFFFNLFIAIFFIVSSYEWNRMSKKKKYKIPGFIFLLISMYLIYLLRGSTEYDLYIFLATILICVSTDIGGYTFGKFFKGPKINKTISPNKTYSGSIGSFLLAIIFFYIYSQNSSLISNNIETNFGQYEFLWVIIISLISQIGDFTISFFKRKAKKKNTGSIIPGHGGLLDRIDGMLFALPFSYIYLSLVPN